LGIEKYPSLKLFSNLKKGTKMKTDLELMQDLYRAKYPDNEIIGCYLFYGYYGVILARKDGWSKPHYVTDYYSKKYFELDGRKGEAQFRSRVNVKSEHGKEYNDAEAQHLFAERIKGIGEGGG
jgi:hypothetical protein